MFQCSNCGSSEFYEDNVRKVFEIDSEFILIENLPAKICNKCGEENFTRDTLVHLQQIIYGEPQKYIKTKAFQYA
jgi:YgiT-type zinc finger domain-containing protein